MSRKFVCHCGVELDLKKRHTMSIIGAQWANNGRDWHGKDGWDIQLLYTTVGDNDPNGFNTVGNRVQESHQKGRSVLVRVDYTPGQSVPYNDPTRGAYMLFLQRMCQDSRYNAHAYGYIIGNEYNLKGENQQAGTPITPNWYARIFNGYNANLSDTGNAYQVIKTYQRNARVLVGPVGPWSADANSSDGSTYQLNVPWLNYFNQVCRNIYQAAQTKGAVEGFAVHAYGRTGVDGTAHGGKNEPHSDVPFGNIPGVQGGFRVYLNWRDVVNQFDATSNVSFWITETNTRTDKDSSSSYPQGWYLEALNEISTHLRFKALCWFVDQNIGGGWSTNCLTNPVGKCVDANNDFNTALRNTNY